MDNLRELVSFRAFRSPGLVDWSPVRRDEEFSLAARAKVASDLVIGAVLVLILLPVMLMIALVVSLDGGPVLFTHRRVGKGGRPFKCLKFRSMILGSEQVLARHLAEHPDALAEWTNTQKLVNDPRITKVGRFLRATSLDELPQLFNVLKLEMSLVGPRPVVENELLRYGRYASYYLRTRPGVTGLWQVSGRSRTSYARRVALDTWYVKNWCFSRDIGILFRTVSVVVKRDGAH